MKIYISGPMRGFPDHNWPRFNEVARELRELGHDVLNPAESFNGEQGLHRKVYMSYDIQLVMISDAVMVLEDWEDSPGACVEVAVAWSLDIPVFVWDGPGDPVGAFTPLDKTLVTVPREHQYLNGVPLIGLSGFAQSGKDEVAKILVSHGWARVAFADPLKNLATSIGWTGAKDDEGRRLLQDLGVGVREHLHSAAWVDRAEHEIEVAGRPVVLTDVRFPNEIRMVRRRKGVMVRVMRPGVEAVNSHQSEHLVNEEDCDVILKNDGSLDDLADNVYRLLEQLHVPLRV